MAHLELYDLLQALVTAILFQQIRASHPREFMGSWAAGEGFRAAALLIAAAVAVWWAVGANVVRGVGFGLAGWFLLSGAWQIAYLGPLPRRPRRLLRVALPIAGGIGAVAWAGAPLLVLGAARLAAASAFASNPLRRRATSIPALLAMTVAAALELAAGAIELPQSLDVMRTLAAWSAALLLVAAAIDDEREAAKQAAAQTEYLAYHDPLTGLANRSLFRDTLMAAISHAERRGFELAVLFIDLDRFKRVNDIAGHSAGDQVLRTAATRMSSCLRREDLLARISGDEFVALIQDANDDEAATSVAFKLLESLDRPLEIAGHVFEIEASIGIARYPRDGESHDELLLASDRAMYRAKNSGGSRVEFVEPHPLATIRLTDRLPIASASGAQ